MIKSNERSTAARIRNGTALLFLSFLFVPICAYIGGRLVVGDYEGESGVLGYLIVIFGDAFQGQWPAIILIFAPLLLVGTWLLTRQIIRLSRSAGHQTH